MSYRESERLRAIEYRDRLFHDPGEGTYKNLPRKFVLSEPILNIWSDIRTDAIDYFTRNNITWWPGNHYGPSGHLLSSQIACINHLFSLRQRKDIASAVLKSISEDVIEAEIIDDGYVEFEFIGEKQYLHEIGFSRGEKCTSIDAVMIGKLCNGTRKLFLIEWKYTELYSIENKYIPKRAEVYDTLITANDSPFRSGINPKAFYYEPFYQLMRQTLLAHECVKQSDHGASSYIHVHVVPEKNGDLKKTITSPFLHGADIHDAWRNVLKDDSLFVVRTPEELMKPAVCGIGDQLYIEYLHERYWA